ncbi:MAG: BsuBI/PstI family type II restriction endonuclease [Acidobacteriota bacterium]
MCSSGQPRTITPEKVSTRRLEGSADLLGRVDFFRIDASRRLDPKKRSELGQFLTPPSIAEFMASMFALGRDSVHLLDPGAGVGSLSAAFVDAACRHSDPPKKLRVTAYEIDPVLVEYLEQMLHACDAVCGQVGIDFSSEIITEDFVHAGVSMIQGDLFVQRAPTRFDCAILNPPYRKIHSDSDERRLLRGIGVETSNLYTAFLALALQLLRPGGELVAITPRSFCNGPYFKPFRSLFLEEMVLRRVHVFHSRDRAFSDDAVLQENVIFYALRKPADRGKVLVSASEEPGDEAMSLRSVGPDEVVHPDDPNAFIRLITDEIENQVVQRMESFGCNLDDLELSVSTGRVVDFRSKGFLRDEPGNDTVPLIYPTHMDRGYVAWPKIGSKKPNALLMAPETEDLLVLADTYVLVKRFSAKEERRRVVAAVHDPSRVPGEAVGFENHLNYYHSDGHGLPSGLGKGLAAFLNSTLVDMFFRQFSGHTQVNATDLRSLLYPPRDRLEALGARIGEEFPSQDELDDLVEEELVDMAKNGLDPIRAKKRIEDALQILKDLGLPREQQNERSALTLLALLDVKSDTPWFEASDPLIGITPMMEFMEQHYGRTYAPNTRETVRRQTVHQFVQAGLVVPNPDDSSRPPNSPKYVYQVVSSLLELVRAYGTAEWERKLRTYLTGVETLKRRYAQERKLRKIPVRVTEGKTINLSPGGQNVLVKKIIEEFCSRFTPGAKVIYVGDAGKKWAYWDPDLLVGLGVTVEEHGKMPDVVVYHEDQGWLVLIEESWVRESQAAGRVEGIISRLEGWSSCRRSSTAGRS